MKKIIISIILFFAVIVSCLQQSKEGDLKHNAPGKIVVYQVFTRLFGNTNTTNKPWERLKIMESVSLMILLIRLYEN